MCSTILDISRDVLKTLLVKLIFMSLSQDTNPPPPPHPPLDKALFSSSQFIWLQALRRAPDLTPGPGQGEALELGLQAADGQPHLVFGSLERLQLHGVEDVEERGGQQDGHAQRGQHVEGDAGEGLVRPQGQPRHGHDGQLQHQQGQAHHPGAGRRVAHPLGAVQAHFDFGAGLCDDVHQFGYFP